MIIKLNSTTIIIIKRRIKIKLRRISHLACSSTCVYTPHPMALPHATATSAPVTAPSSTCTTCIAQQRKKRAFSKVARALSEPHHIPSIMTNQSRTHPCHQTMSHHARQRRGPTGRARAQQVGTHVRPAPPCRVQSEVSCMRRVLVHVNVQAAMMMLESATTRGSAWP